MVKYGKSVLFLVFAVILAVILSFILASRLSACVVSEVHIWAGKTPTDAAGKVNPPTSSAYTLKDSTTYFYGEATAYSDDQHRQLKWTYCVFRSKGATHSGKGATYSAQRSHPPVIQ